MQRNDKLLNKIAERAKLDEEDKLFLELALRQYNLQLGHPIDVNTFDEYKGKDEGHKRRLKQDADIIGERLFPADYVTLKIDELVDGIPDAKQASSGFLGKLFRTTPKTKFLHAATPGKLASDIKHFKEDMLALNQYRKLRAEIGIENLPQSDEAKTNFLNNIRAGRLTPDRLDTHLATLRNSRGAAPENLHSALTALWGNEKGEIPEAAQQYGETFARGTEDYTNRRTRPLIPDSETDVTERADVGNTEEAGVEDTEEADVEDIHAEFKEEKAAGDTMSNPRTDIIITNLKRELQKKYRLTDDKTPTFDQKEFQAGGAIFNGITVLHQNYDTTQDLFDEGDINESISGEIAALFDAKESKAGDIGNRVAQLQKALSTRTTITPQDRSTLTSLVEAINTISSDMNLKAIPSSKPKSTSDLQNERNKKIDEMIDEVKKTNAVYLNAEPYEQGLINTTLTQLGNAVKTAFADVKTTHLPSDSDFKTGIAGLLSLAADLKTTPDAKTATTHTARLGLPNADTITSDIQLIHRAFVDKAKAVQKKQEDARNAALASLYSIIEQAGAENKEAASAATVVNIKNALRDKFAPPHLARIQPEEQKVSAAAKQLFRHLADPAKAFPSDPSLFTGLGLDEPTDNAARKQIIDAMQIRHREIILDRIESNLGSPMNTAWQELSTAIKKIPINADYHMSEEKFRSDFTALYSGDPNEPTVDSIKNLYAPLATLDAKILLPVAQRIKEENERANILKIDTLLNSVGDFDCRLREEKSYSDPFKASVNATAKTLYNTDLKAAVKVGLSKNKLIEDMKGTPLIPRIKERVEALVSNAVNSDSAQLDKTISDGFALLAPGVPLPPGVKTKLTELHKSAINDKALMHQKAIKDDTLTALAIILSKAEAEIKGSVEYKSEDKDFTQKTYHTAINTQWGILKAAMVAAATAEATKDIAPASAFLKSVKDLNADAAGKDIAKVFTALLTKTSARLDPTGMINLLGLKSGKPAAAINILDHRDLTPIAAKIEEANKIAEAEIVKNASDKTRNVTLAFDPSQFVATYNSTNPLLAGEEAEIKSAFEELKNFLKPVHEKEIPSRITDSKKTREELVGKLHAILTRDKPFSADEIYGIFTPPLGETEKKNEIAKSFIAKTNEIRAERVVKELERALLTPPPRPVDDKKISAGDTPLKFAEKISIEQTRTKKVNDLLAAYRPKLATAAKNAIEKAAEKKQLSAGASIVDGATTLAAIQSALPDPLFDEKAVPGSSALSYADKEALAKKIAEANREHYASYMREKLAEGAVTKLKEYKSTLENLRKATAEAGKILPAPSSTESTIIATARKSLADAPKLIADADQILKATEDAESAARQQIQAFQDHPNADKNNDEVMRDALRRYEATATKALDDLKKADFNTQLTAHLKTIQLALPMDSPASLIDEHAKLTQAYNASKQAFDQIVDKATQPRNHEIWFGKRAKLLSRQPAEPGLLQRANNEGLFAHTADQIARSHYSATLSNEEQPLYNQYLNVFNLGRQKDLIGELLDTYQRTHHLLESARGSSDAFAKLEEARLKLRDLHTVIAREVDENRLNFSPANKQILINLQTNFTKLDHQMEQTHKQGAPKKVRVYSDDTKVVSEDDFKVWTASRKFSLPEDAAMRGVHRTPAGSAKNVDPTGADVVIRIYPADSSKESSKNAAVMYEKTVKSTGQYEIVLSEQQSAVSDRTLLANFLTNEMEKLKWKASYINAPGGSVNKDATLKKIIQDLPPTLSDSHLRDLFASKISVSRPASFHNDEAVIKKFNEYRSAHRHTVVYLTKDKHILTRDNTERDLATGAIIPSSPKPVNPHSNRPDYQPTAKERLTCTEVIIPGEKMLQDAELFLSSALRSGSHPIEIMAKNKDLLFAVVCLIRLCPEVFASKFSLPPREDYKEPTKDQIAAVKAMDILQNPNLPFRARMGATTAQGIDLTRQRIEQEQNTELKSAPSRRP